MIGLSCSMTSGDWLCTHNKDPSLQVKLVKHKDFNRSLVLTPEQSANLLQVLSTHCRPPMHNRNTIPLSNLNKMCIRARTFALANTTADSNFHFPLGWRSFAKNMHEVTILSDKEQEHIRYESLGYGKRT
jgi:hypothetical protein